MTAGKQNPVWAIIAVRTVFATVLTGLLQWALKIPYQSLVSHEIGLGVTVALCLSFVFTFVAPFSWGLPIVTRLPKTEPPAIALTFDDGPSELTGEIGTILERYAVPATFFVLGERVIERPEILARVSKGGHSLGVHAARHRALVLSAPETVCAQIQETANLVHAITGEWPQWFRPPYGFKTLQMPWLARRVGCQMVTWSLDSRDYVCSDPDEIARRVLDGVSPGAIVLLHDGPTNTATVAALPMILEGLRERGYACVRLDM